MELQKTYFDLMIKGDKTIEGRKASPTWKVLQPNTYIDVKCATTGRIRKFFIISIDICKDIYEYLDKYLDQALPGLNYQEAFNVYSALWKDELFKYPIMAIRMTSFA